MSRTLNWKVSLPRGEWMSGYLHSFRTKERAEDFIARWNHCQATMNKPSVTFERDGRTFQPAQ